MIIPEGIKPKDIGREVIGLGHPLESLVREFEDSKNPKNIFDFKVIYNKKFKGLKNKKNQSQYLKKLNKS